MVIFTSPARVWPVPHRLLHGRDVPPGLGRGDIAPAGNYGPGHSPEPNLPAIVVLQDYVRAAVTVTAEIRGAFDMPALVGHPDLSEPERRVAVHLGDPY